MIMAPLIVLALTLCLSTSVYGSWQQQGQSQYLAYPLGYYQVYDPFNLYNPNNNGRQASRGDARVNRGGNQQGARSDQSGARGSAGSNQKLPAPETYVNPQDAVAFSAVETHDQFFYKAGPLVFDNVITNIGGGYNSEYGVFTAPVPGIYTINYHATSKPDSQKPVHVDLMRNSEVINSAKGSGSSGTPSNSALLYLEQFDRVTVTGRAGTAIGCGNNTRFCTFNVALLKIGKFADHKTPRAFPMDKW